MGDSMYNTLFVNKRSRLRRVSNRQKCPGHSLRIMHPWVRERNWEIWDGTLVIWRPKVPLVNHFYFEYFRFFSFKFKFSFHFSFFFINCFHLYEKFIFHLYNQGGPRSILQLHYLTMNLTILQHLTTPFLTLYMCKAFSKFWPVYIAHVKCVHL